MKPRSTRAGFRKRNDLVQVVVEVPAHVAEKFVESAPEMVRTLVASEAEREVKRLEHGKVEAFEAKPGDLVEVGGRIFEVMPSLGLRRTNKAKMRSAALGDEADLDAPEFWSAQLRTAVRNTKPGARAKPASAFMQDDLAPSSSHDDWHSTRGDGDDFRRD